MTVRSTSKICFKIRYNTYVEGTLANIYVSKRYYTREVAL